MYANKLQYCKWCHIYNVFKCGDCNVERVKCHKCYRLISGGMEVITGFGTFHKACLPDSDTSEVSLGECTICKLIVRKGGVNAPGIGYVHIECFKCSDCGNNFGDDETPGSFLGKFICQACATVRREAMADPCCNCGKPIVDAPKLAMHKKFHKDCVRCWKCSRDLLWEAKNLGVDGKLYCDGCHRK